MQLILAGTFAIDRCLACSCTWLDGGELELLAVNPKVTRGLVRVLLPCVTCGKRLWSGTLGAASVSVCAECRGLLIENGQLEGQLRAQPRRPVTLTFSCMKCETRTELAAGRVLGARLGCARCVPLSPTVKPAWYVALEALGHLFQLGGSF